MARKLGREENKVLRFIGRREERGDPSPGMREICCAVGLEGSQEVREILSGLICGGYLDYDVGYRRMLELTGRGWRMIEELAAAESDEARFFTAGLLDEELLQEPGGARLRLLRPTPESLASAGMREGELIVIEEEPYPADGELVAALLQGETVLGKISYDGESPSLTPASETMRDPGDGPCAEPSVPVRAAEMYGRVVYVVRPPAL